MNEIGSGHPWQRVLSGMMRAVRLGYVPPRDERRQAQAIFPGSFNPLHEGHQRMAEIAGQMLGRKVEFELSVVNVDKPPLDQHDVHQRVQQFDEREIVWVTRTPSFSEKARLFPEATFIVGADTMQRIVQPKYYRGGSEGMQRELTLLWRRNCEFLVFGRKIDDRFVTAADLDLPDEVRQRCRTVAAEEFRMDISSSTQRRAQRR